MGKNDDCPKPKEHPRHICKLKKKGMQDEITRRTSQPQVTCSKCGVRANQPEDLCRPE